MIKEEERKKGSIKRETKGKERMKKRSGRRTALP